MAGAFIRAKNWRGKSASPSVGPVISVCIRNEEHGTINFLYHDTRRGGKFKNNTLLIKFGD